MGRSPVAPRINSETKTMSRKCRACKYWEPLYPNESLGDHQSGLCGWLSAQYPVPMWLTPDNAIIYAQTLAGAGNDCRAWCLSEDTRYE